MFGYVMPLEGELLVKEYELYKAIYCGLCRTGGKRISRLTRIFLSYDFTALATLRLALGTEAPSIEKKLCLYAMKRKQSLVCDGVFAYVAAAFGCLMYAKAEDDVRDEGGLLKRLSLPLFRRMKKRAEKLYGGLYGQVAAPLDRLSALEADGERHTLDTFADCFAEALSSIAAFGLEGAAAAIAKEAGYHIGRYIYIIDAVDDLQADFGRGRFNPLLCHYGGYEEAVRDMERISETLTASAVRFSAAVGLAECSVYTDILQNIARYGMEKTVRDIYDKYAYTRKEIEKL